MSIRKTISCWTIKQKVHQQHGRSTETLPNQQKEWEMSWLEVNWKPGAETCNTTHVWRSNSTVLNKQQDKWGKLQIQSTGIKLNKANGMHCYIFHCLDALSWRIFPGHWFLNTQKPKSKYGFCSKEVVLIVTVLECAETLHKLFLRSWAWLYIFFQWESMLREGTERLGLGLAQRYSLLERVRGQMSGRESQQLRAPYQEGSALWSGQSPIVYNQTTMGWWMGCQCPHFPTCGTFRATGNTWQSLKK